MSLLDKLLEASSPGLDMSPGDPLCGEAYQQITKLQAAVKDTLKEIARQESRPPRQAEPYEDGCPHDVYELQGILEEALSESGRPDPKDAKILELEREIADLRDLLERAYDLYGGDALETEDCEDPRCVLHEAIGKKLGKKPCAG